MHYILVPVISYLSHNINIYAVVVIISIEKSKNITGIDDCHTLTTMQKSKLLLCLKLLIVLILMHETCEVYCYVETRYR